jgi:hypothetical protein
MVIGNEKALIKAFLKQNRYNFANRPKMAWPGSPSAHGSGASRRAGRMVQAEIDLCQPNHGQARVWKTRPFRAWPGLTKADAWQGGAKKLFDTDVSAEPKLMAALPNEFMGEMFDR